ncbi:hypothetical protein [Piscirickettsia salmonis]|nr:hypothetical protein [Piscirickettsia salmonis]
MSRQLIGYTMISVAGSREQVCLMRNLMLFFVKIFFYFKEEDKD